MNTNEKFYRIDDDTLAFAMEYDGTEDGRQQINEWLHAEKQPGEAAASFAGILHSRWRLVNETVAGGWVTITYTPYGPTFDYFDEADFWRKFTR